MLLNFTNLITNQLVLIFLAVVGGMLLGRIKIGKFSLGTSGVLFSGLIISWFVYRLFALQPEYAGRLLAGGIISGDIFQFSLVIFIAAAGLLAAGGLGKFLKLYGSRLFALGFIIPAVGAITCYLLSLLNADSNPLAVAGVYTGALTSSPGLAAAIESASRHGESAEALVGLGHAVGYMPGVISVIMAVQYIPHLFHIDLAREMEIMKREIYRQGAITINRVEGFDIPAFFLVCIAGYFLGSVKIYLGPVIKYFSLGSTGGVLVAALVLGYLGRIGKLNFRMSEEILAVVKEIALAIFLATVGLRYGFVTIDSLSGDGLYLMLVSFITAITAITIGFIIGRFLLKLNWIILAGGICGSMTSTPGLGAAIEATSSDWTAVGYGASYPFGLLGMVLFTILLHTLPIY